MEDMKDSDGPGASWMDRTGTAVFLCGGALDGCSVM